MKKNEKYKKLNYEKQMKSLKYIQYEKLEIHDGDFPLFWFSLFFDGFFG